MTAPDPGPILVDGDARDTVETHLHRNLFVEAGAGTGKTTVLVRRVVRLFATGHLADPSGLVAITFTEAAAAQLRDRIRTELERAAVDADRPDVERRRCLAAARRIDDAVVTTLHGFAQRILAEHPLEAGLPPAFEVEEGIPAELAFADRWRAFVDDLFAHPDLADDLRMAITLGLPMYRLREVTRLFCDRWDKVAAATFPDPGSPPTVDPAPILASLRSAVDRLGDRRGSDDYLAERVERAEPAVAAISAAVATGDPYELLRTLDWVGLPTPGNVGRKEVWGDDKPLVQADLTAAIASRDEQLGALRRHLLARFLPRIADFTVRWAEERSAAGRLHFHDLLVLARRLLWQPDGRVRCLLAERYRVILVDEFQDTDPIQVELVVALAAADPAAPLPSRWQDVELGHGRVLVVGDPKQSIYGFRGADVTLWHDVRARFGDDVVTLSQNFRSVAPILDWVNGVFEEVMGDGTRHTQPPYVALDAARAHGPDVDAVEAFGGPAAEGMRAGDVRLDEAADVAAAVGELRASGRVRYADIALLLPTRTPLGAVERALDDAAVPYRVESRSLVWGTDVVRELLAVLTAIEDPADEVAVVAALRAPAFACRDDELLDYQRAGGRWDPTAGVDGEPPEGLAPDHPVVAAMGWLRAKHQQRWWVPVNELVDAVVRERRLVELCFAQRRPRDHWRRLRFVVDQARAFVEAGGSSLAEFLGWAALQVDEGAMAVETVVPEPDDDAVRILTVHGSKGLEFPVVVLAGLTTGGAITGSRVLWADDGPQVRVTVPNRNGVAFATPGFDDLAGEVKLADDDEAIRLLYVAATRARDQLLVSVHHKPGGKKTHAQLLYERCEALGVHRRPRVVGAEALRLLDPDAGSVPAPPPVTSEERAARLAAVDAVLARAARPSVVAPTGIADPADPADDDSHGPVDSTRRGGTAVGRAVHGVLEAVPIDGREPVALGLVQRLAAAMVAAEGLPDDAVATVAELAVSALASSAIADARAAGRAWREVPVVAPVGDRVVEGFVDLLHEAPDGTLVVVDWKTDRARTPAEIDAALGRYRLQGAGYAAAIEAATGRPVSAVRFVFCRAGGQPAVEREITDLAAAVAEVQARLS